MDPRGSSSFSRTTCEYSITFQGAVVGHGSKGRRGKHRTQDEINIDGSNTTVAPGVQWAGEEWDVWDHHCVYFCRESFPYSLQNTEYLGVLCTVLTPGPPYALPINLPSGVHVVDDDQDSAGLGLNLKLKPRVSGDSIGSHRHYTDVDVELCLLGLYADCHVCSHVWFRFYPLKEHPEAILERIVATPLDFPILSLELLFRCPRLILSPMNPKPENPRTLSFSRGARPPPEAEASAKASSASEAV